ncbi:MAG: VOC family protein, partial [Actinomycetota bacterium]|nr:VOC family protein [Actinomycetota bacterium]
IVVHPPTHDGMPAILFGRSTDEKTVKNRWHLDLNPDDQAREVARLKSLGATEIDIGQKDVSWIVMADPEGNEFCVRTPR